MKHHTLRLTLVLLLVASLVTAAPPTPTPTAKTTRTISTHSSMTTSSHPANTPTTPRSTSKVTTSKPTTHSLPQTTATHATISTPKTTKPTPHPTHPLTTSSHKASTPTHRPTTAKPQSIRVDSIQVNLTSVTAFPIELTSEHFTPNDTIWVTVHLTQWHHTPHDHFGIVIHDQSTPKHTLHLVNGTAHFNLTTPTWKGPFTQYHTWGIEAWKNDDPSTYLYYSEKLPDYFHRSVPELPPGVGSGVAYFEDTIKLGPGPKGYGKAQGHVALGYTKL